MSDEHVQEQQEQTVEDVEKKSNKTFTQSEFDSRVAQIENDYRNKYKDYDELKTSYETLTKNEQERKEAEMSEVEKLTVRLTEQTKLVDSLTKENYQFKLDSVANKVLEDSRYKELPRAYKNMVKRSENEEDVTKSADEILEEFKRDFGKPSDFGAKKIPVNTVLPANAAPKGIVESIKAEIANRAAKGKASLPR